MPALLKKRQHQETATARKSWRLPLSARRHALVLEVETQLKTCGVVPDRGRAAVQLVIGVSGGADSMALLLACAALASRSSPRIALTVVHVHHHLRKEATADAAFVKRVCRSLDIPCVIEHVHPSRLNGNTSANARDLRYAALARQARRHRARFVLTAHHAEDQLETMLMALCRGTGIEGLAGMAMVRPLKGDIALVRPLLECTKADCVDLCRQADLGWREDASNRDLTKSRARIRHEVVPVLESLWPGSARRAAETARLLRNVATLVDERIHETFGDGQHHRWQRDHLRSVSSPILAGGLHRAALSLNPSIADQLTRRHLAEATAAIQSSDNHRKSFDWPGQMRVSISSKGVSLDIIAEPSRRSPRGKRRKR